MIEGLVESFSELPDPRCPGRVRHRFIDTLVIAVGAVIAGAETWLDMATDGVMKEDWLKTFLDLNDGVPSPDTFRRVFTLINPSNFEQCFYQWVAGYAQVLDREVIAALLTTAHNRGRCPSSAPLPLSKV